MKAQKPLPRISEKRLKSLGGKIPWSSITAPKKKIRAKPRKKVERERIYGPPGYVEWIHEQPCVACGWNGDSQCAHIKTGGTGRKDDWTRTVPLCGQHWRGLIFSPGCHNLLHGWGKRDFEKIRRLDLAEEAEENHAAWEAANV